MATVINTFDHLFLHEGISGRQAYIQTVDAAKKMIADTMREMKEPYCGESPASIEAMIRGMKLASLEGEDLQYVLKDVEKLLLHSIHVNHKTCIAHLHCPPLLPALAAEMVISASNQSMDSWDQSSAATYLEEEMIQWLCRRLGLENRSDGTFTSGGTQSNYMGLLLARDEFCDKQWNWNVQKKGLPPDASRLRILCSKAAHFTVKKSASQLGLGEDAVIQVETDSFHRLSLPDFRKKLRTLKSENLLPFALVGTCGTTDFGSIDPLGKMAESAQENGLWFHVDAAYGGALILSRNEFHKLQGIEKADSITVDFHKLFYQPISCGAFFLKEKRNFKYLNYHADYLNPEEDEQEGLLHLVNKSVQTTRRFDALKLFMSLRSVGLEPFGRMIDHTIELAAQTSKQMQQLGGFNVINPNPEMNAIVFRYEPPEAMDHCKLNREIHRAMLYSGQAVLAKTNHRGHTYLKFTLLNPRTTIADINAMLLKISELGNWILRNGGQLNEQQDTSRASYY
ncbi:pyridoxal phosphate-dependent decarboxylase family protein [Fictibacillus terranigra]|uniref:Aspartate aminotransferase family protein n=1 Tax=Fictibacillus terranigra TaxID=3058424 RepID=A0ABT8E7T0_9BACL|nr:aspartate aminotransferase family protein [Fictibacillus sp. CENA-BCM004]MDN4073977.1 aspartate aminotransferase family protein [Fictibacillus sp. CENA-BCM004]